MPLFRRPWPQALALSGAAGLAVAGLGTVPGMGLPGAFVMLLAEPVFGLLAAGPRLYPRDAAWPFALLLTWLVGALVPVAWMATRRWRGVARAAIFLLLWALSAMLGAVAFYWWGIAGR